MSIIFFQICDFDYLNSFRKLEKIKCNFIINQIISAARKKGHIMEMLRKPEVTEYVNEK